MKRLAFVVVLLMFSPLQSHAQALCGDFDDDGQVTVSDAFRHLRFAVGLGESLMCPGGGLPRTGQTTVYGAGSDGDVQAGALLSYTDNGDGTITDDNTGLMWEKKDDSGGIHDKDNTYLWSAGVVSSSIGAINMDGTIATTFLSTLNDVAGGGANCFAGHCDWRVSNVRELQTIVDYEAFSPTVDPAFHRPTTCSGCADVTLTTCSCTMWSTYWSSTSTAGSPHTAWLVSFLEGYVFLDFKTRGRHVRAVRGGL
ncbi:MAG: DUF1566 domain-containing protein [Candidatus Krumholzibacteriia bacterium]